MKAWLRSFEEPLISTSYYDECISHLLNHVVSRFSDALSLTLQRIMEIFESLSDSRKHLIMAIAELCRRISSPSLISSNKMTLNNLAVVFSQGILRPAKLLSDPIHSAIAAKKEVKFVTQLLSRIPIQEEFLHVGFEGYGEDDSDHLSSPFSMSTEQDRPDARIAIESVEQRPPPLPPKRLSTLTWKKHLDDEGNAYFFNPTSGESKWKE